MKKIVAVSILVLGLAGCTAREQQLVAVGVVGALAGTIVANSASSSNHRTYHASPRVYHHPRMHPRCYSIWDRSPYGMRERRICN